MIATLKAADAGVCDGMARLTAAVDGLAESPADLQGVLRDLSSAAIHLVESRNLISQVLHRLDPTYRCCEPFDVRARIEALAKFLALPDNNPAGG